MSDIHDPKILWGSITLLIAILGFFIRGWVSSVKEDFKGVKDKLACKQDRTLCDERYPKIQDDIDNLYNHKHSSDEGEVIIK